MEVENDNISCKAKEAVFVESCGMPPQTPIVKERSLYNAICEELNDHDLREAAVNRMEGMAIPGFELKEICAKFINFHSCYCQEQKKIADSERKPVESYGKGNKLVRSGSISSANPATSTVLRPSTSTYNHTADNVTNVSPESQSASSSSSGGVLSPTPDQPLDKQCIFCLERSEAFTEEGLNTHYWKSCPMLMRCQHCQEVVEVASLNQHLADECDLRKLYKRCDHCSDVLQIDSIDDHENSPSCLRSKTPDIPQTSSSMYNFR